MDDRLSRSVEVLKDEVPLDLPVRVTRPKKMQEWGTCEKLADPDRFLIRVHKELDPDWAVAILVHEWAHARTWVEDPRLDHHGPEWGVAYARCYQALFGR